MAERKPEPKEVPKLARKEVGRVARLGLALIGFDVALFTRMLVPINPLDAFSAYLVFAMRVLFTVMVIAGVLIGPINNVVLAMALLLVVPSFLLGVFALFSKPLFNYVAPYVARARNPITQAAFEVAVLMSFGLPYALPYFWAGKFIGAAILALSYAQPSAQQLGAVTLSPGETLALGVAYLVTLLGVAGLVAGPVLGAARGAVKVYGPVGALVSGAAFLIGIAIAAPVALISTLALTAYIVVAKGLDMAKQAIEQYCNVFSPTFNVMQCGGAVFNALNIFNPASTITAAIMAAAKVVAPFNSLLLSLIVLDLMAKLMNKLLGKSVGVPAWGLFTVILASAGMMGLTGAWIIGPVMVLLAGAMVYVATRSSVHLYRALMWAVATPGIAHALGGITYALVSFSAPATVLLTVVQIMLMVGMVVFGILIIVFLAGLIAVAGPLASFAVPILAMAIAAYIPVAAAVIVAIKEMTAAAFAAGTAQACLAAPFTACALAP